MKTRWSSRAQGTIAGFFPTSLWALSAYADEGTLGFGVPWRSPFGGAVLTLALLVLWLSWRNLSARLQGATLAGMALWRLAIIGALCGLALQPVAVSERPVNSQRVTAVLLDASTSMRHQRRWQRALAQARRSDSAIEVFRFGEQLHRVEDVSKAGQATEARSDLEGALTALAGPQRPTGLSQVVVISDGIVPSLRQGIGPRLRSALTRLAVPVHTIGLPDTDPKRDVVVKEIRVSPFGFVRSELPVEVDLLLHGLQSAKGNVDLVLSLNGEPIARKQVPLAGQAQRTVQMTLHPRKLGPQVLTATVPLQDELTVANNRRHRQLNVLRDRVRVMQLAGHPSWDVRFLRQHFRNTPGVDLVSFYIMVGPAGLMARSSETALVPFPTQQLFGPSLEDFDLIIFQNFDFRPFGITEHLPGLERWVRKGGGFWVLGGPNTLVTRQWQNSSLNRWLPVHLSGERQRGWSNQFVTAKRTTVGERHLVTHVGKRLEDDRALWRRLQIEGFNTGLMAKAGASVLLQGPKKQPLLVLDDHQRGRVAVWATDSLWTWAFPAADGGDDTRDAYHRFIRRLQAWTLRDGICPSPLCRGPGHRSPPRPRANGHRGRRRSIARPTWCLYGDAPGARSSAAKRASRTPTAKRSCGGVHLAAQGDAQGDETVLAIAVQEHTEEARSTRQLEDLGGPEQLWGAELSRPARRPAYAGR